MGKLPRTQHVRFTNTIVPGLAFKMPGAFLATVASEKLNDFLTQWWEEASREEGAQFPKKPSDGLSAEMVRENKMVYVLFSMPTPEAPAEAHYSGFAFGPLEAGMEGDAVPIRYLAVEEVVDDHGNPETPRLVEHDKNRQRTILGDFPDPTRDSFLASLKELAPG